MIIIVELVQPGDGHAHFIKFVVVAVRVRGTGPLGHRDLLFGDNPIDQIVESVNSADLDFVQLHGDQSIEYALNEHIISTIGLLVRKLCSKSEIEQS